MAIDRKGRDVSHGLTGCLDVQDGSENETPGTLSTCQVLLVPNSQMFGSGLSVGVEFDLKTLSKNASIRQEV